MRHHGWQLPYHPLQIVAVSVFFALVFGFYVFFIPFLGSRILEIAVIVLYSPTVVVVFGLYVWCVAINPADDGVLRRRKGVKQQPSKSINSYSIPSSKMDDKFDIELASRSNMGTNLDEITPEKNIKSDYINEKSTDENVIPHWECTLSAVIQSCQHKSDTEFHFKEEDMLYCSLCKVEIYKDSKHCRVCDKCIDGFDHHCRWLNNCIGRKNYKDFVALMVSAIAMLILQWAVGLWVLVHYFLSMSSFQSLISSKLGSSFSSVAYIIVVALCTLLSMAATYPLCQLFLFHALLIKKGISTYDYIVAMREQDQKVTGEAPQSPLSSPASSDRTATSGGSPVGALEGHPWCTPPRLLLDNEQSVQLPAIGRVGSAKDSGPGISGRIQLEKKKPVKLNPWNLASLNKDEVLRIATIAKKNSTILRPVNNNSTMVDAVSNASSVVSSRDFMPTISTSDGDRNQENAHVNVKEHSTTPASITQRGKFPVMSFDGSGSDSGDVNQLGRRGRRILNPLQMEAMNAFKTSQGFSTNGTTMSSSGSSGSSEQLGSPVNHLDAFEVAEASGVPSDWQYNVQGSAGSLGDSEGDMSSPCTPIRHVYTG